MNKFNFKTKGRDLDTVVKDYVAEADGMVIKVDEFHAAHLYFPGGVEYVELDVTSDKTPEQGVRTLTISADPGGVQERVTIRDPVRGEKTFNVSDKVVMTFAMIRYKGENYYYRVGYEYIK